MTDSQSAVGCPGSIFGPANRWHHLRLQDGGAGNQEEASAKGCHGQIWNLSFSALSTSKSSKIYVHQCFPTVVQILSVVLEVVCGGARRTPEHLPSWEQEQTQQIVGREELQSMLSMLEKAFPSILRLILVFESGFWIHEVNTSVLLVVH